MKTNKVLVLIVVLLVGFILYDKGVFLKDFLKIKKELEFIAVEKQDDVSSDIFKKDDSEIEIKQFENKEISCAEEVLSEINKKQIKYVSGSVIVSFRPEVSFSSAKNLIENFNFSIKDEVSAQTRFENNQKWFVVSVLKGKEIEAICDFRKNDLIKYSWVEALLPIHE